MKYLILSCVILIAGCKKKDNPAPVSSLQNAADSIGFKFERTYNIFGTNIEDSIIFHANGTIREFSKSFDTVYNAVYSISRNNIISVYQNGITISVYVPDAVSYKGIAQFLVSAGFSQKNNDTLLISTFESGPGVYNNKASLGCQYGSGGNTLYLWLN